jgi:hypothetical protein
MKKLTQNRKICYIQRENTMRTTAADKKNSFERLATTSPSLFLFP